MTGVLNDILAVFLAVAEWISEAVLSLVPMFYDENGLTFLGILSIAGLAISVAFLLIGIIQRFLNFRGN